MLHYINLAVTNKSDGWFTAFFLQVTCYNNSVVRNESNSYFTAFLFKVVAFSQYMPTFLKIAQNAPLQISNACDEKENGNIVKQVKQIFNNCH